MRRGTKQGMRWGTEKLWGTEMVKGTKMVNGTKMVRGDGNGEGGTVKFMNHMNHM